MLVTHDIGTITDKVTHVVCLNKHLYFHGETEEFEELRKRMGCLSFMGLTSKCYHISMTTILVMKHGGNCPMIDAILQYEFLQNAFLTGIIIGIIAPLIRCFRCC